MIMISFFCVQNVIKRRCSWGKYQFDAIKLTHPNFDSKEILDYLNLDETECEYDGFQKLLPSIIKYSLVHYACRMI